MVRIAGPPVGAADSFQPNHGQPWDGKPRVPPGQPGCLLRQTGGNSGTESYGSVLTKRMAELPVLYAEGRTNMRTLRFLIIVWAFVAVAAPHAFGAVTAMTEAELDAVTGQAGVVVSVDHLNLASDIKTVAFGDDDSGWLSMNDVKMTSFVNFETPLEMQIVTEFNPYTGHEMEMMKVNLSDMHIRMDEFSIGSITVGARPGEGNSFGSIHMSGFEARISGDVRIWAH